MKQNLTFKSVLVLVSMFCAMSECFATEYTSIKTGNFTDSDTWSGSPTLAQMQDKSNSFKVVNGYTVTVDDSINVLNLTVENGILLFGKTAEKDLPIIVNGSFTVLANGQAIVSDVVGTHTLHVKAGFTSSGVINFRKGTGKAVNVVFEGSQNVSVDEGKLDDGLTDKTIFSNFTVAAGTVVANSNLSIKGSLSINSGATFNATNKTIQLTGNYTNAGTLTYTGSTFVFNSRAVQSISGTANFNNISVSGGGFLVISSNINVYGNFEISENSTVSSSANLYFCGNFSVAAGSKYDTNTGVTDFCGDDGSGKGGLLNQTITIDGEAIFNILRFYSNEKGGVKTYKGNINATSYVRVYKNTRLVDVVGNYNHTFVGAIVTGDMNLQNPMTIKGGTLRYHEDKTIFGEFSLGTGDITIQTNDVSVKAGDTFIVKGDITVETGSLVIAGTEEKQAEVYGNEDNTSTLTVYDGARLYIRGGADAFANDNFPKRFASVTLGESSTTYYDSKFNQKVHGATYGHLALDYYDKTFTGNSFIAGHLYMRPMTNGESTVYFGDYSHTLCYNFYDEPDRKGTTSIKSSGIITLKSTGSHGQTIFKRTNGKYEFKDLIIANDDPSNAQTKTIGGEIFVDGELTLTNSSSNELLLLSLDLDANYIHGSGGERNNLVMGSNTCIKISGADNFEELTTSFRNVTLDANSIVQFDANDVAQEIPAVDYGNIIIYGNTAKNVNNSITIGGWISRSGGTPKLTITDENVTVHILGDWKLDAAYLNIIKDATISFEGAQQEIVATTLPNVIIRGSDTKILKGNLTVEGDLTVYSGCRFNADSRTINLYGNFDNSFGGGGQYSQIGGRLNLRGDGYDQTVVCGNIENTKLYHVYIEKTKNDKVTFLSDILVSGNLVTSENRGSIDIEGHTLTLGGDLTLSRYCSLIYTDGAMLHFNGSNLEQQISNKNTDNIYPTMKFSGNAVKRYTDNAFDIDGDVIINNGAIVTAGVKLKVSGNWENSGTFNSSSEVEFDGAEQLISGSAFNNVTFGGTNTKKLNGIINLTGWLKIDSLATLDVSPDDGNTYYNITVSGHWYNNIVGPSGATGKFVPREGTVTFMGNSSDIYSGDSLDMNGVGRVGKSFHNVVINTSDPTNYIRLYPIHGSDATKMTYENDLYVENDFTINTGIFYFYWNRMFVGGNVRNLGGNLSMNGHYDARNILFLGGAAGNTFEFNPGETNTIRQVIINNGAKYLLTNSYLQYTSTESAPRDSIINIKKGILWMKACDITFYEAGGVKIGKEGTLHMDSAAVLEIPNGRKILNNGKLELIGDVNAPAKIQPTSADATYSLIQEGPDASFEADQFCIEGTRGNGLDIKGGKIKGINNGTFSNSTGTALLKLEGINLGSGLTADNITFNAKGSTPTYNVWRTSGDGSITFTNYGGTMAGEAKEYDSGDRIKWKMPDGCVWTGKGTNNKWHNPDNWANKTVPNKDSVVILNHSWPGLPDNYTILVDERAEVKNLTIDTGVTLDLNGEEGGKDGLEVFGKLSMMTGSTLVQNNKRDSLILHGSWTCSGTYNHNHIPAVFDMYAGSYQFILHDGTDMGALVVRSSKDGALSLVGKINVVDSVRYESGTLYGGTGAKVFLYGDWIPAGGVFETGESIVNFCSTSKEQVVRGGRFWEIQFNGAGAKKIDKDITVNRTVNIQSGSGTITAAYRNIYMSGRTTYWYNYEGPEVFVQSGDGAVIFNGGSAAIGKVTNGVPETKPTEFNNLIMQGTSTKYIRDKTFVDGSFEMIPGVDVQIDRQGSLWGKNEEIATNSSSVFTQYGGALLIYGRDNFPKAFDLYDLNGGSVYYRDSAEYQIVSSQSYNTLYLYNYYFTTYGTLKYTRKILDGDITVKGTLNIYDSVTTVEVQGNTITLSGNLALAEKGKQIVWGDGGTVKHVGGSWEVDADITVLNNVYKKGTGYLYQNSDLTVNGDIEFDPETRHYMRGFKMTGNGGNYKMGINCQLHTAVVKGEDNSKAIPTNFDNFELDPTSTTYLEAAADQILHCGVIYGNLYLNNTASRTVEMNGDLRVMGNFYNNQDGTVLDDKGMYNLYLSGATNDLRNYRPTTTTVYLNGDIDQKVLAGGGFTELNLNNLVLSGEGVKEIDETLIKIAGDVTIGTNTSFSSNDAIEFSGDNITNHGTFRHYGSTFTFKGDNTHTISMGGDNIFNSFSLADDVTVNIVDTGIVVNTGAFSLGKRAELNMGRFTHKIASSQIDLGADCNWITENANLIFNRSGGQTIPALTCKNIQFSTSSTKTLAGKLTADTLTIDEGVTFSVGSDAKKSNRVIVYGDWICNGSFTSHNDTVFFESKEACKTRKIKTNEQWFSDVVFHKTTKMVATDTSKFLLQDKMQLKNNMVIDTGAVLCLNHNTLVIGNDDTNLTDPPYYPDGEGITVNKGGELHIDAGASLQFDHLDGYPYLTVNGRLTMVGSPSANAVITRSSSKHDTHGTQITINKGAKLAARFYQVQYLAPSGFVINNGAIIDDNNNLSDGIWSNMYTTYGYKNPFQADDNVKIDSLVYLTINVDKMKNPIENIAFNHGGTPTVGHHFNISRNFSLPNHIIIKGTINGALGWPEYKLHTDLPDGESLEGHELVCNIEWPAIDQIEWTGKVSQDWFDRRNWRPMQVPDKDHSVRIPMTSNAPIIYKQGTTGAQCKNLTITKGSLTIENITKTLDLPSLFVNGTVEVQDGGVFAIEDVADVKVMGDWNIAQKGYFVPQNGTVIFAAKGGSVSIVPRRSDFNNVQFEGDATYMFTGTTINFNGDFIVNKGLVWPSSADYTYNIGGNFSIASEGGYNNDIVGYVKFVGGNQTIENGKFNRVTFSNTGTKLISGTFDAKYNNSSRTARTVIVEGSAVMKAAAGCSLTIKGNVLINSGAGFNDGGETHTFTGYYWESAGNYEGTGKIVFNANHAQYIWGGKFHDVDMTLNTKYISGDVTMTGNLNMESCTLDMLVNHITSSGTFVMGNKSNVYARGDDNYPTFVYYEVPGGSTCYSYYSGPMNQTIRAAKYGNLYLNSNTVKTLEGHIVVVNNLYFYENGGTLRSNNKNIYVGQHWYNQYSGTFEPGEGRVIFNGSNGTQCAYLGVSVENPFYDIEIDKPEGQQFYASSVDLNIDGSLYVTSGKMHCVSGYRVRIGGDVTVGGSGIISQSGHYELRHSDGNCSIQTNGSILNDLTLNGNCTFELSDDITVYGNFTLQQGTFCQNHHVATLGNSLDNIAIYGTYQVTEGGKLRIGDGTSLVVKDGGVFQALGDESNYALITNNSGRYYFTVESGGMIMANYYNFSYLAKQGLIISDGATIHGKMNFSNGVFSNVVSGGVCLDIRNNQRMEGDDLDGKIKNISFPNNPGGGAVNIRKVESSEGEIEVFNATGLLAGELYENDPHNKIRWTGDVEYTWTGAKSEDWWDKGNWIAKLNGSPVATDIPTADNNVIIPVTANGNYPVITYLAKDSGAASAKRVTVNNGAYLTIKITTDNIDTVRCALNATSDVTIEGTLTMNSVIDTLKLGGNWVIGTKGKFAAGEGTVVMSGVGVKTIQNRTQNFNNLVIDNNGTMQAQAAMKVGGNFIIEQGVFDVTSYDVTVGGSFINNSTFIPQTRTLILGGTATPADPAGHKFNPGGNSYYNVTVKGGTYNLDGNDLFVTRNLDIDGGTLNAVSRELNIGDGTGVDNANITGTLVLGRDGKLKMGNNAIINVNTAGTISLEGDVNHDAIITSQKINGTYAFNVYGTIAANQYKIERINAVGVHLFSSAVISGTLSNGQFVSGAPGGRYIWFENNFGTDNNDTIKISNVYFNAGPDVNAKRVDASTNGVICFVDAVGVVASRFFEDDDKSAITGAIVWKYSGKVLQWIGGGVVPDYDENGTRWDNELNWENPAGDAGYPTSETQVHIYPVNSGLYPIVYNDNDGDACAKGITLYEGASLTLNAGRKLKVEDAKFGLIIGKNAKFTAYDSVFIKGQFSNAGTFDHGNSSTVVWQSSLNRDIEMNGCPFYNFIVKNEDGTTVTFSVEPGKSLVVKNDFTIESGTVNCNGGILEVGGNFINKAGTFLHGNGTVKMNGGSLQRLSSPASLLTFYDVEFTGNGKKEIESGIEVIRNITVGSTVQAMDEVDITCRGDWKRPASTSIENTFIGGSGWVKFVGTSMQTIGKPETFTNLEINNTSSSTAVSTTHQQTISGKLNLAKGVFNSSGIVCLESDAEILNGGKISYINGAIKKVDAESGFKFPIGSNDRYAPIEISDFTGTGTYQVSYKAEMPKNQTNLGEAVNSISKKEYWTLNRISGTDMPRVTLHWMSRTLSGLEDLDVLSVVLYTGNKWTRMGEMIKNDDLHPAPGFERDTAEGWLISRLPLTASGEITFGFSYPTITWLENAADNVFITNANWDPSKYRPKATVNIKVDKVTTSIYPTVLAEGHCYDMTITSNGKLKVADNMTLTVHGNATIDGELELGSGSQIIFMKDVFAADATVTAAEGSKVIMGGDVDNQILNLKSCYDLVLRGGNDDMKKYTKTLSSDIEVNGSISIEKYTLLTGIGKDISLKGDFTINSAGDLKGTTNLIMCGSGKQRLAITPNKPLYNLTINNSAPGESGVDLGTGIVVDGNLELEQGILRSKSNARLCLGKDATSSLGSANSYVIGQMQKNGKADFTFPIGSEAHGLAQIGVAGLSASVYMVAEYVTAKPPLVANLDESLKKVSHLESWHLGTDNETKAYLTLYWNDSAYSQIYKPEDLLVAVVENGKWKSIGKGSVEYVVDKGHITSAQKVTIKGDYTTPRATMRQSTRRTLTANTPHTLAAGGGLAVTFGTMNPAENPLPIELLSFDAVVADNNADVRLTWSTASEHNNDYFIVEHMFDGESETIDTIAAKGGAGEGADYSYLHINLSAGTHYYRLLQTDFDGNTTVAAEWVSVVVEDAEHPVLEASVAPNPGKCQNIKISVSGITGSKLRYVVADMSGQTLIDRTISTDGMSAFQIDASDWNLQPSVYLVKVFTDNGQTVSKFVVE